MKRILALLLACSLCFGMLPMPGLAEEAEQEEALETVLEEERSDEAVQSEEPETPEEPEEGLQVEFMEGAPALVITEQPEDTLAVEGVAYFAVAAQVEQDGLALEGAEVSFQWQKLEGDTWISLEGQTQDVLTVEAPEQGAVYRCRITWEDLEAISNAASVIGEEAPLDMNFAVWVNPVYRDLYSEESFAFSSDVATTAATVSCSSREKALSAIREAMVNREASITLYLNYSFSSITTECKFVVGHMFDHNGDPKEGDYLYYALGGYRYGWGGNQVILQNIDYYTTAAQEAKADTAVDRILGSLNLDGKTNKQKVDAIYGYLTHNVTYDYANLNNSSYKAKYAGYAALVNKTAVCQGFAGAFYRLCLEEGIDSRLIACQNMNHAWNIVQLGNFYYHLDATWDINTPNNPRYYLKGTKNWLRYHTINNISELGDQFKDASFAESYPVPEEDYKEEKGYTITYQNVPAGVQNPNPTMGYPSGAVTLKDLSRTGYLFDGWFDQKDERVTRIPAGQTANVVLSAKWTPITYTILFDGNGASNDWAIEDIPYDADVELFSGGFDRPGYMLVGWNTEPDGSGIAYALGQTVRNLCDTQDGEAVLYAQWADKSAYTISFDGNGGAGSIADITVRLGVQVTLPQSGFTNPGFSFLGWNTKADGTGIGYAPGQKVSDLTEEGAITLYAQWAKKGYQIAFEGNSDGELSGTTGALQASWDQAVTLPECGFAVRGYSFTGWNTQADGTGTMYQSGDTVRNLAEEGTVFLYAQWKPITYTIILEGNGNGERWFIYDLVYDERFYFSSDDVLRPGYTLTGWNTQADGSGTAYAIKETMVNLCDTQNGVVTLYAQWEANSYTILFDGNGGTGSVEKIEAVYDTPVTLPQNGFTKPNVAFIGWNTQADGKGQMYQPGDTVQNLAEEGTVTLYAQWRADGYTILFDGNAEGLTGQTPAIQAPWDQEITLPECGFINGGYSFVGWNTQADGEGQMYQPGDTVRNLAKEGTVTLYAQWEARSYTIFYDGNGGQGSLPADKVAYDQVIMLSNGVEFTYPGHSFVGWNTKADGTGTGYASAQLVSGLTEEDSITLYAQWQEKGYTILFDGNAEGLTGQTPAVRAPWNADVSLPECGFVNSGYTFIGWNTWADGRGRMLQPGDTVRNLVDEGTVTLYAQWEAGIYRAVFLPGAEEYTGSVAPMEDLVGGKSYRVPQNGYSRPGYTFAGWYAEGLEDELYQPGDTFSLSADQESEVVFYARWTPITYTVRFNANKGTGRMADRKDIAYDAATELPNAFTRKGYHFVGWNTKANGTGEEVEEAYQLTATNKATVTLYAMWEANEYTVVFHGPDGEVETQTMTYDRNEVLEPNVFEKDGFTFAKWNTQENGKGKSYTNKAKVKNLTAEEGDVDLYAQWTPNKYNVVFHSNYATGKNTTKKQPMIYGKKAALTANGFRQKGYGFRGWALDPEGAAEYENKQTVVNLTLGQTIDLYALWEPSQYTIVLDSNGAGQAAVRQEMTYGQTEPLYSEPFQRTGYTFTGWSTTAKGKVKYWDGQSVGNLTDKDGGEVKLYAVWAPYSYRVVYAPGAEDTTGKTAEMKNLVNGKQYTSASCGYKRPGYVFDGWQKPDGTKLAARGKFAFDCAEDGQTLYFAATWKPITYKVRFNANKGTGKMADETGFVYDAAKPLSKNAFTRKGYSFAGWNTKANGTGLSYTDGQAVQKLIAANNGTVTLYAQWKANSYKVLFHANGGTGTMAPMAMTYDKTQKLTANTFVNQGYKFQGWATAPGSTKVTYKNGANVKNLTTEGQITLYAVWKK